MKSLLKDELALRHIPRFHIVEGVLTDEVINELIQMCDDVYHDGKQRNTTNPVRWSGFENHGKDYDSALVGRMDTPKSKQLQIDPKHPMVQNLVHVLIEATNQYVGSFREFGGGVMLGSGLPEKFDIHIDDMWTVHQYEGDYNPVHFHNSNHHSTLSGFLHLKVPEQIPKGYFDEKKLDGITELLWDTSTADYMRQFIYNGNQHHVPYPGLFAVFPSWLNHVVYPFKGPGERLSMSWNIGINYK